MVSKSSDRPADGTMGSAGVLPPEEDIDAMFAEAMAVDALLQRAARISFVISSSIDCCLTPVVEVGTTDAPRVAPAFGAGNPSL